MMVVDTSALMAVVLDEALASECSEAIEADQTLLISAGTFTETMIVATARGVVPEIMALIDGFGIQVVPVDAATAKRIGGVHQRWGKGMHRAALNFGDCFAYDLAREQNCPLLYVGKDFAQTDVKSAI